MIQPLDAADPAVRRPMLDPPADAPPQAERRNRIPLWANPRIGLLVLLVGLVVLFTALRPAFLNTRAHARADAGRHQRLPRRRARPAGGAVPRAHEHGGAADGRDERVRDRPGVRPAGYSADRRSDHRTRRRRRARRAGRPRDRPHRGELVHRHARPRLRPRRPGLAAVRALHRRRLVRAPSRPAWRRSDRTRWPTTARATSAGRRCRCWCRSRSSRPSSSASFSAGRGSAARS